MILSIPGGIDFFIKKKRFIALVSFTALVLLVLSLSFQDKNEYLTSIYPHARISEINFDEDLNSEYCFAEYVYDVHDGDRNFQCYFIKSMGYEDYVYYMVEVDDKNERIDRIRLIDENETEDYGGYIREGWFLERFENMSLDHPTEIVKIRKENNYEIVAITGATITSQTASDAVNLAMKMYKVKTKKN